MDFAISSRVWADSTLTSSEKMVLLALDHLGDADGFSWYGYERLAEITGINLKSKYLTKIINKLEKTGYILIWRQHGRKGGRGYTHIYWPIIGRTDDQILEVIMRRFFATEEEARAIIGQSGPIYDELIKRNRVSGKTLEDSREIGKGVTKTPIDNKGYTDYTQSNDIGVPETPINETDDKKGVLGTPRLLDSSSLESNPLESLTDNLDSSPNGEGGKPPPSEEPLPDKPTEPVRRQNRQTIPAVQVFVEVTGKHVLNNTQIKVLDERVGRDPPALEKWRETVTAWQMRGNKINNIDGMLDWFRKGIPVYQNGVSKSGHHGPSQNNPVTDPGLETGGLSETSKALAAAWDSKRRGSRDPT